MNSCNSPFSLFLLYLRQVFIKYKSLYVDRRRHKLSTLFFNFKVFLVWRWSTKPAGNSIGYLYVPPQQCAEGPICPLPSFWHGLESRRHGLENRAQWADIWVRKAHASNVQPSSKKRFKCPKKACNFSY
jgi:hypothetical protein